MIKLHSHAGSSNGRTAAFGAAYLGSNPSPAAKVFDLTSRSFAGICDLTYLGSFIVQTKCTILCRAYIYPSPAAIFRQGYGIALPYFILVVLGKGKSGLDKALRNFLDI